MTGVTIYEPVAGQAIVEWTKTTVETRESWSGSWVAQDYLEAIVATETAAPNIGEARFRYRYAGELKREDQTAFGPATPLSLAGHYIRIRAIPGGSIGAEQSQAVTLWVGVVVAEMFDILGTEEGGDPMGDQGILAYGLEHLLDRHVIGSAWAQDDDGAEEVEIGWAPVFNERYRRGTYETGNLGETSGGSGSVFGGTDVWNFKQIAEYVLARFNPPDVEFELSGQTQKLADVEDIVPQEGRTPWQILNHVISRARGYGFCVRYNDRSEAVNLHVYTLVGSAVSFGKFRLPGNGEQASMAFDDARDIGRAIVSVDESSRYDEVHVLGARVKSCFTLSAADGTLDKTWTDAEEDAYVETDLGDPKKNDLVRSEDRYWRVFQVFGPPEGWEWTVGENGEDHVVPYFDDEGNLAQRDENGNKVDGAATRALKNFERKLPFEKAGLIDHAEPEYLDPLAIVQIPIDLVSSEGGYGAQDTFGQIETLWTYWLSPGMVRMVDRELSIHLSTSPHHALALEHWDTESRTAGETTQEPQVDWLTLLVTVCLATDVRLKVRATIKTKLDASGPTRVLVVNVPDAEYWHVVKNTVTSLQNGKLQRHGGGPERDDSDRLRAIATWCKAWYGKPRSRVDLSLQKVFFGLRVGTYVTDASSSWHSTEVGTVVTQRSWYFGDGAGSRPATRIRTDYLEPLPEMMG